MTNIPDYYAPVATPPAGGDKPLREILAEIRAEHKKKIYWLRRKGK